MAMMHSQINRATSSALSGRVIPKLRNFVSSKSSSGNRDTEARWSQNSQEKRENTTGLETKTFEKDSRTACDLRTTEDHCSCIYLYEGSAVFGPHRV